MNTTTGGRSITTSTSLPRFAPHGLRARERQSGCRGHELHFAGIGKLHPGSNESLEDGGASGGRRGNVIRPTGVRPESHLDRDTVRGERSEPNAQWRLRPYGLDRHCCGFDRSDGSREVGRVIEVDFDRSPPNR